MTFTSLSYAADNEDSTAAPPEATAPLSPAAQKSRIEPSLDENRIQELVKNTPEETELLQLDTGKATKNLLVFTARKVAVSLKAVLLYFLTRTLIWHGQTT